MHENSFLAMKKILASLPDTAPLRVLDVGSRVWGHDVCYRDALPSADWHYTGMDTEAGDNVDCVLKDVHHWPFPDASFDLVISGQCAEHAEDLHSFFRELGRVLKNGGMACVIAPWNWRIHRYPKDCWRILPDGMCYLLEQVAGLTHANTFTIDSRLENVAGAEHLPLGDFLIRRPGSEAEVRLADFMLEGGTRLGDLVIEGDCVGVGLKPS